MGRPSIPQEKRARNAGLTAYPHEIEAMKDAAAAEKFEGPFDFVRDCVIRRDHPKTRGKMKAPRKIQKEKPDPARSPNSPRR